MNLKALITTLVLGSSTMASADSVKISGSVNVSLGGRPAPAPNYRPAPAPVVVADPCEAPAAPAYVPAPSQPAYHPVPSAPIWQAPYYRITNTLVSRLDRGVEDQVDPVERSPQLWLRREADPGVVRPHRGDADRQQPRALHHRRRQGPVQQAPAPGARCR